MAAQTPLQIFPEDRFDRLRRISWWEQEKVSSAKVLVIGAGAIGNEILKNLALLGVGQIFVADLDVIELSNLSRSVLYRQQDVGRPKAEVAAKAVKDIYPGVKIQPFHGDVIYELGLGVYRWADLVIAGLDSREARLHVNRCCYRANRPWIDAATEVFQGVVRVFRPPVGPCYECTMTVADWQALNERRGCAGLRTERPPAGQTPTTAVTASILAAIQSQEAMKLLHQLDGLAGHGWVFNGLTNDSYIFAYHRSDECNSHQILLGLVRLRGSVYTLTLRSVLEKAIDLLGPGTCLELVHELLVSFDCPHCRDVQPVWRPLGVVSEQEAICPRCGKERRPITTQSIWGHEEFLDRTFASIGVPPFDVIVARNGLVTLGFEFGGDAIAVLGELYEPADG